VASGSGGGFDPFVGRAPLACRDEVLPALRRAGSAAGRFSRFGAARFFGAVAFER
jgi:hypothetical protein